MLTLSDGSNILLDDSEDGILATQGNTSVTKSNEKLKYKPGGRSDEIMYNTITTPRGGQYTVQLPDGSTVWLNASSSITFPTEFFGKERRVEITGEVYFEVAKNTENPFIASVQDAEIQVLGTHFNVKAYSDEHNIETSLLEGAVNFSKAEKSALLKPGQQSSLSADGKIRVLNDVNMNEVVAWKNGYFDFEGSDFENVAKQLSRWYDVDVVYEKNIDDLFYAKIPRNTKLSDVLKALELTGKIKFGIKNNRIIVNP